MSDFSHLICMVGVMAGVTVFIRAFPFLLFGGGRKPSPTILYLGAVMSPAAIAMLVVYCYKDIRIFQYPYALPELIAGAVVIGLHVWKKNSLLSIISGTVLYMVLIQMVF